MHVLVAWPLILICPINEAGYGGDSILLRFAPPPLFFVMRIAFIIKMEDSFTERVVFSESKRHDGHDFQISFFCLCFSASFFFLSLIYLFIFSFNSKLTALGRDIVQLVQASSITTKWTTFLLLVRRTRTVLNRPSLT